MGRGDTEDEQLCEYVRVISMRSSIRSSGPSDDGVQLSCHAQRADDSGRLSEVVFTSVCYLDHCVPLIWSDQDVRFAALIRFEA